MKKRLLSAALALAMVLTMLPLTVFAEDPPKATPVVYVAENGKFPTPLAEGQAETASSAGWYSWTTDPDAPVAADRNKRSYSSGPKTNGFVDKTTNNGAAFTTGTTGNWLGSMEDVLKQTSGWTTIRLVGDENIACTLTKNNITIDLGGKNASGTIQFPAKVANSNGTESDASAITLNIKDSAYPSGGSAYNASNSTFSISSESRKNPVTVNLNNVNTNGAIALTTATGSSVSLTSSEAGAISITNSATSGSSGTVKLATGSKCTSIAVSATGIAYASNTVQVDGGSRVDAGAITLTNGVSGGVVKVGTVNDNSRNTVAGGISITTTGVTGNAGQVEAYNADIVNVTLKGAGSSSNNGTKLSATNCTLGVVSVLGSDDGSLDSAKVGSYGTPSVTLHNSTATKICEGSGEVLTKAYSVTLNENSDGGVVDLTNASVTINNSKTGTITLKSGSLTINGATSKPASTGALTLADSGKVVTFTVTGSNVTTAGVECVASGKVQVSVPSGNENSLGAFNDNSGAGTFEKVSGNKGISGGVHGGPIPAGLLDVDVHYQVVRGTSPAEYVYYTEPQFQKLIDEYAKYGNNAGFEITIVQDDSTPKESVITFKNGSEILTKIKYGKSGLGIELPRMINGGNILKWTEYDGDEHGTEDTTVVRGSPESSYSTPVDMTTGTAVYPNRVLNAQVSDNTITKLDNVTSGVDGVTARLVGNVITLSGAVPSSNCEITVSVTTDGQPATTADVRVNYNNGKVTFVNQVLKAGMSISNDYTTLIINNGTATYTLNGSGLKLQASKLKDKVIGYSGDCPVIVTVSLNGTGWTNQAKTALATAMSSDFAGYVVDDTLAGASSKVNFGGSTAVKEALNAVVAGIPDSQVDSWILAAQNTSWRKVNKTGTPDESQRKGTGYNSVYVVAYMAVNITNYNTANKPGTLTMTLTPSYYVEVRRDTTNHDLYELNPAVASEKNVLRPRNTTLGNLTGDIGTITIEMAVEKTGSTAKFDVTNAVAHQASTYAYKLDDSSKDVIKFSIKNKDKDALGSFVINGDAPMVTLYDKKDDASDATKAKAHYDTLQAAVDATTKDDQYIVVDANYKGSTQVNMTGNPRKIIVNTNGANRVSSSNATGTVVKELAAGTEFELQLARETTTPTATTASISTVNAANGTARANVSSAKAGDRVTITTTAYNGYKAAAPIVRTNTGAAVSVAAAGNTSSTTAQWTFTVPSGATSITITPSFTQSIIPFTDVRSDAWYYGGVAYCYNTTAPNGSSLMVGESSSIFAPERPVKRAEVAVLLYRLGNGSVETPKVNFTDVVTGYYAYNAIVWCYNHGYVRGYGDDTFKPEQYVTRQELAQMLYNYAGTRVNYNLSSNYTDGENVPAYHSDAMSWAAYYNILSGTNSVNMSGALSNKSDALRGQVAVTLMNFHQRYVR